MKYILLDNILSISDLYFQMAPISLIHNKIKENLPYWPSIESQNLLYKLISPYYQEFLLENIDNLNKNLLKPSKSYRKSFFQLLEKDINREIAQFDDEYMEEVIEAMMPLSSDSEDPGYVSYVILQHMKLKKEKKSNQIKIELKESLEDFDFELLSNLITQYNNPKIPLLIFKSHNQVGTKVWGAGLFLGELFQYMSIENNEEKEEINNNNNNKKNIFYNKKLLELGSGVGITGYLLGKSLPNDNKNLIILSDVFDDVMKLLNYNTFLYDNYINNLEYNLKDLNKYIQIDNNNVNEELHPLIIQHNNLTNQIFNNNLLNIDDKIILSSLLPQYSSIKIDWNTCKAEDLISLNCDCIFAADCTYSEDLNLSLLTLFDQYLNHDYFKSSLNKKLNLENYNKFKNIANYYDENKSNPNTNINQEIDKNSLLFLPSYLLNNEQKFILIACTVRHPLTFNHFLYHLTQKSGLSFYDISSSAHQIIEKELYTYDFRERIRLYCIVSSEI